MTDTNEPIRLGEIPSEEIGEINELSPEKKAQQTMTYWVLGGVTLLFFLSGAAFIFTDGSPGIHKDLITACPHAEKQQIIDFCNK